ncbi:hypothetical protein B0H10DRAFT_2003671, partial [Mycena sp. CBHHK59/15]
MRLDVLSGPGNLRKTQVAFGLPPLIMGRRLTPKMNAILTTCPSRSSRLTRASASQVKAERVESVVPTASSRSSSSATLRADVLEGDAPLYQPPTGYASDHENDRVYFNTYDDTEKLKKSEIYCCDFRTKRWKNITKSIHHLPPPLGSPRRKEQLPSRYGAGMAFYKSTIHRQHMLLLYGGQTDGLATAPGAVSNELIAVDVDNTKWWVVHVAGGKAVPRVQSRLVVSGDTFCIFGGKTFVGGAFQPINSFCVATFRDMEWRWDVLDEPYPSHIPPLGWCCPATVVDRGRKILLNVGCTDREDEVDVSADTIVLFNITERVFEAQPRPGGNFPGTVSYYHLASFDEDGRLPTSSVVFCAFYVRPGEPRYELELYVYSYAPEKGGSMSTDEGWCKSLEKRRPLAAVEQNLEVFVVVRSRMYLIGYGENSQRYKVFVESLGSGCVV